MHANTSTNAPPAAEGTACRSSSRALLLDEHDLSSSSSLSLNEHEEREEGAHSEGGADGGAHDGGEDAGGEGDDEGADGGNDGGGVGSGAAKKVPDGALDDDAPTGGAIGKVVTGVSDGAA